MRLGIGDEFIEQTKHKYLDPSDQQRGLPQPPLETPFAAGADAIELPAPSGVDSDLRHIIGGRTSVRRYEAVPLSQAELSYLLWCTQGIRQVIGGQATLRTVPSAGARHALETYLLVNRVDELTPGLYRYLALDHKIGAFRTDDDIAGRITHACLRQEFVRQSAVTFIWVAVAERMVWRYQQRGYRYLFLDAGHVCQNLYLAAESIGCGACAIAAFDDDAMNSLLQLDGEQEFVIYVAAVGKKRS